MASGLPCLVADAIGSKSLVRNSVNGYWANKEDVADFTEKLKLIVGDDSKRLEMGKKSREFALEYQWDAINGELLENYMEAVANFKR